jgi:glycosyltransferase involved in cell wall biosynthesis
MRICIYTKTLAKRIDEGFLRVAHEVIHEAARHHQVLALFSQGDSPETEGLKRIPANSVCLSPRLRASVRAFGPDAILYIPRSGASFHSLWIARLLAWYGDGVPVGVLTTQPQEFAPLARMALPLVRPDLILTASRRDQQELAGMGCTAQFIPLGVDLEKFVPATPGRKTELRAKYGVGREQFVALHVGHLSRGRNIRALEQVQEGGHQVLIAVSTFFAHDRSLMGDLEARGVRFATQYSDHIEELYQLADCYLFPVLSERACIGQPLSVLEAMACNLPVVTTRFGGLPDLFPREERGLLYVDGTSQMPAKVSYLRQAFRNASPGTRALVEPYSWRRTGGEIMGLMGQLVSDDATNRRPEDHASGTSQGKGS